MEYRAWIEPQQGTTYDAVLGLATAAERLGFDGFFTSDHYRAMGDSDGLPGPLDAWTTMAGLARDTEQLRLGTLITPVTFRHIGPWVVAVTQIDHMSGGRIDVSLGAGWFDEEHAAAAVPFPGMGERFDRMEEALEIMTGLWATPVGERFSYDGVHLQIVDSPALPKPKQRPHPPIIIGGGGPRRTPQLAARFATEFNLPFTPIHGWLQQRDRVRAACEAIDRDPDELVWSSAFVVCCGRDEAELARRAAAIDREPDELRDAGAAGLVDEVIETLSSWAEAGAERMYLQVLDIDDTDHLELLAAEVFPNVG